jgi:hypothetical protein
MGFYFVFQIWLVIVWMSNESDYGLRVLEDKPIRRLTFKSFALFYVLVMHVLNFQN